MKKLFIISLLALASSPAGAQWHIGVEAGYGSASANSNYDNSSSFVVGAMAGRQFLKFLIADVGIRSWSANYTATYAMKDIVGAPVGNWDYDMKLNSISFPLSVGIYYPVKKFNILAKVVAAPTLLSNSQPSFESGQVTGTPPEWEADGSFYFAAGADIGVGYDITSKLSVDVKYSYLTYTSEVKYKETAPLLFNTVPVADKPKLSAFTVQLNLFL